MRVSSRLGFLLLSGLSLGPPYVAAQGTSPIREASEYEVKAAFLLNFARFVEWPMPEGPGQPIRICLLGQDPFGGALERLAEGEAVDGRPIMVSKVSTPTGGGCQILFVPSAEREGLRARKPPAGVLTVGEDPSFFRDGGMINFAIENRRVRFDVNLKAAESGSVRLSSRLLGVARSVLR